MESESLLLSAEQQIDIEKYASYFFSPDEIVLIMNLDSDVFNRFRLEQSDFNTPFKRGRLLQEAKIRQSIINLAVNGSSPAQILAINLIDKTTLNSIAI